MVDDIAVGISGKFGGVDPDPDRPRLWPLSGHRKEESVSIGAMNHRLGFPGSFYSFKFQVRTARKLSNRSFFDVSEPCGDITRLEAKR